MTTPGTMHQGIKVKNACASSKRACSQHSSPDWSAIHGPASNLAAVLQHQIDRLDADPFPAQFATGWRWYQHFHAALPGASNAEAQIHIGSWLAAISPSARITPISVAGLHGKVGDALPAAPPFQTMTYAPSRRVPPVAHLHRGRDLRCGRLGARAEVEIHVWPEQRRVCVGLARTHKAELDLHVRHGRGGGWDSPSDFSRAVAISAIIRLSY